MPVSGLGAASMSHLVTHFEHAIEAAMRPGDFIDYEQSWDFVYRLKGVAADVRELIGSRRTAEAVTLFGTFIVACYEKAEEIDDSSGSFGMFVGDLFCDWVRARQAAKARPEETVELLLTWMKSDEYGFCHELDREIVEVLDERGLRVFAEEVRRRLDASGPDDGGVAGYPRRRWTTVLKRILVAQGDAEAFVALAGESAMTSEDCSVVAQMYERRGDLEEALAWVERGLERVRRASSSAEYVLKELQRELLPRLGRAAEAIAAAWTDFEARPSTHAYQTLMELVDQNERRVWHERAMAAAADGDLGSIIGLFVETGEVDRLAVRIEHASDHELEMVSHYGTELAAKMLAESHPAVAARVYRAMGLRIVEAGKSKYYDAALQNLADARDCYLAAGQQAVWEALVTDIRARHRRKRSFMDGFVRVASGGPATEPRPSFLERAKKRWPKKGV